MSGSSNGQHSVMNPNEKISSPPPLQPNGGVPSIFLARSNNSVSTECSDSSSQSTQTSVWSSDVDIQQEQNSPPSSAAAMADSYKMKTCASTQCGYEGPTASSNLSVGGCQPSSLQNRMYAPYIQQQQIAMPMCSMHQHHHHHHHGVPGCHPHHPQQSSITVTPHHGRMVHGGSSAVAVAAAQQMRSMVMNHYPPNSAGYPHQASAPTASSYYQQTVAAGAAGNGPFNEYSPSHQHPHHHHHHGHGISAAAAAAVQYAHQQQQHHQRMISSAAAATLTPYRQVPVHHHQKVISSNQATVAYQSAYQQYNHFLHHHHGMVPHSHPHHQNGSAQSGAGGVMQQRVLGIPVANLQQQQQAFKNRTSHHLPVDNNCYSSACQPHLVSNYTGASQQQQQLVHPITGPAGVASNTSNPTPCQLLDVNNNSTSAKSKTMGSSTDIPGSKSIKKKTYSEALIVSQKGHSNSSMKVSSTKLSATSPAKSVKIKAARSVTKLRDRQPRLVVGQKKIKKKSAGNLSVKKKLKPLLESDSTGDEVVSMQPDELFEGTTCTCRRVDAICPTRPPPGFEHLSRPAFPIELYDPSLLGSLIGGQLPREVLSSLDSSSIPRKQFEEMEELLISLTCCEKHAVDKMLYSRRSSISLSSDEDDLHDDSDDDWEALEKAIKTVLNEWTEELGFRKRMQDILFTLNLHDVYGGCCKNLMPFEPENLSPAFGLTTSASSPSPRHFSMAATPPLEEELSIFPQSDDDDEP